VGSSPGKTNWWSDGLTRTKTNKKILSQEAKAVLPPILSKRISLYFLFFLNYSIDPQKRTFGASIENIWCEYREHLVRVKRTFSATFERKKYSPYIQQFRTPFCDKFLKIFSKTKKNIRLTDVLFSAYNETVRC